MVILGIFNDFFELIVKSGTTSKVFNLRSAARWLKLGQSQVLQWWPQTHIRTGFGMDKAG